MDETKLKEDISPNSYLSFNVKEFFLDELKSKYKGLKINRKELAYELDISEKSISNQISLSTFPIKHIKGKKYTQSTIYFWIDDVAEFLTKELYISYIYM